MARYRLRFQLQEIDLSPGNTILGRSPDCHVTIEDPLVSRQHAKLSIENGLILFEDLGSRNGSRVNGVLARGKVPVQDGDRLRIGTQEFVFCKISSDRSGPLNRKTGFLLYCANCKLPYAEEMVACPHCGSQERTEEEQTLTGVKGDDHSSWALLLVIDVLDRAVSSQRFSDAERMMRRAATAVDDLVTSKAPIDSAQFEKFADVASRYAAAQRSDQWASWLLATYVAVGLVPHPEVVSQLRGIRLEGASGAKAIDSIIESAKSRRDRLSDEDVEALSILELWGQSLKRNTGA
ncbi:MAG: FHA domain-containing protein [Deltaproteobacteria bacterium]|nr:FHA domain-containing protein [Deltaproteobacteria bacterium]